MSSKNLRCMQCYRIVDVQEVHEIYIQDEGIRDGHYFAVYAHGPKRPYCDKCRHRIAALERLIGMQQRAGEDIHWNGDKR